MPEVLEANFANLFINHASLTTLHSLPLRGLLADGKKTIDTSQTLYSFMALHIVNLCIVDRAPKDEHEYLKTYKYQLRAIDRYVQKVQHFWRSIVSILEAGARARDKKNEHILKKDQLQAIRSHTPNQPPVIAPAPVRVGYRPLRAKPSPAGFKRTSLDHSSERVPSPPPPPPRSPITRPLEEKSSVPPWSHFVRPLTFNAPIFRGRDGANLYPGPYIPQLACSSDGLAYASANLQLVGGYFHSRAYTLEFSAQRFFVIRPLLHTSVNLYTKAVWSKWIGNAYSKGFVVVIAFDFGSHVLSFNSKDGNVQFSWSIGLPEWINSTPSPICPNILARTYPSLSLKEQKEASLPAFLTWLALVLQWIRIHLNSQVSLYTALTKDHTVFDFLGVYSTIEVLALAGLNPTNLVCDIVKCPSRTARLCVATYVFIWNGHVQNCRRLTKALKYDQVGICATLNEVKEYNDELICYGRMTTSVSRSVASLMDQQHGGRALETDLFHLSSLVLSDTNLHVGTSIRNQLPQLIGGLQDLVFGNVVLSGSLDPLTLFYQDCLRHNSPISHLDLDTHLPSSILQESRRIPRNVNLFCKGGIKIWTLFQASPDPDWQLQSRCDQEQKSFEYIKSTQRMHVVGPLDFCGITEVMIQGKLRVLIYARNNEEEDDDDDNNKRNKKDRTRPYIIPTHPIRPAILQRLKKRQSIQKRTRATVLSSIKTGKWSAFSYKLQRTKDEKRWGLRNAKMRRVICNRQAARRERRKAQNAL